MFLANEYAHNLSVVRLSEAILTKTLGFVPVPSLRTSLYSESLMEHILYIAAVVSA